MRRTIRRAALLGAVLAVGVTASAAADETKVLTGHVAAEQPDWVYVPFDVPSGTNRVDVAYSYDRTGGNALDIGLFDGDGTGLFHGRGFRGWSGGARTSFTVAAGDATPGYRPGRIEPGRWNVVLGPYTVAAAGLDYRVEVTLHSGPQGARFRPTPAPDRVRGRRPGWFRGDLHLHTEYSDGRFTPRDIVDRAKAAGLDYFVSTEHNTDAANSVWGSVVPRNLLSIRGEEVTTRGGHWGAVGLPPDTWIDWRYRPADDLLGRAVAQVHAVRGLAVANHPAAPCKACGWSFPYAPMDAIEVWNGVWDPTDETALARWDGLLRDGSHIVAVGASDAHRDPDVVGRPQTVVRARRLATRNVVDGIRAGHAYVAETAAVDAVLRVRAGRRSAGPGDRLLTRRARARLVVRGVPGGSVTFVTDRGRVPAGTVAGASGIVTTRVAGVRWVRAEVRKPDGSMAALTNPVWLGRGR